MSFKSFGACRNGDICACARYLCQPWGGLTQQAEEQCGNNDWVRGLERSLESDALTTIRRLSMKKGDSITALHEFKTNFVLPDHRANYVKDNINDFCNVPPMRPAWVFKHAPDPATYKEPVVSEEPVTNSEYHWTPELHEVFSPEVILGTATTYYAISRLAGRGVRNSRPVFQKFGLAGNAAWVASMIAIGVLLPSTASANTNSPENPDEERDLFGEILEGVVTGIVCFPLGCNEAL